MASRVYDVLVENDSILLKYKQLVREQDGIPVEEEKLPSSPFHNLLGEGMTPN